MKFNDYWRLSIWFLIMCYLLFVPANELPVQPFLKIPHLDKIVHFSMFFILCTLLFRPVKKLTPNYYFWAPFTAVFLALTLEYVQQKISPSRHTDIHDFWANLAGLSFAALIFRFVINGKKLEKLV